MASTATNFGLSLDERLNPSIAAFDQIQTLIGQKLRVMLVGIVQSFDADAQTVVVQVATQELVQWSPAGPSAPVNIQVQPMNLPVLSDVPIQILGAGGWSVTFPIKAGDECVLLFSDTALDIWFQQGATDGPVAPLSVRRHDLSDAIAIFGLRSQPRQFDNYSIDSMQIRSDDGTVVVDLADDTITVTAPNVTVNCSDTAQVNAKEANVVATDAATVQGKSVTIQGSTGDIVITTNGNATLFSSGTTQISGTGAVHISSGTVSIGSATTIDGKLFLDHQHSGVSTGGGTSGPVV